MSNGNDINIDTLASCLAVNYPNDELRKANEALFKTVKYFSITLSFIVSKTKSFLSFFIDNLLQFRA